MRVAAGPPTAEPQIDALYVGALSVLLVSVLHCSGVSSVALVCFWVARLQQCLLRTGVWTERHRSRASPRCSLLPGGMSTSTADGEVCAAFRAMLSAERAGYKLAVALVSTLVSYLVGTAELSDVSELDMSTLLTTANEAWAATHDGEELPNVHRSCLQRWLANVPASIAVDGDASVAVSPSTASGDEDLAKLFGCARMLRFV